MTTNNTTAVTDIDAADFCWKAADLRGSYPDQISADLFYRIGRAVGEMLGTGSRIIVAGDLRLSTPTLKGALAYGLLEAGGDVFDAGQVPTPVAYFTASRYRPDALLIITASHNPAHENGLKLLFHGRPPTPEQMLQLRELTAGARPSNGRGVLSSIDGLPQYEQFMVERWKHLKPFTLPNVVLDAGNGTWSESAPRIFGALGFRVQCLSCVPDGRFPDRPSDCSRPANLVRLRERISHSPGSLGIAWDGDGDRVAFVDETGKAVSADELSMLLTRELFERPGREPGSDMDVVIDLKLASVVQRVVIDVGGRPQLERTGHAFMRRRMITSSARLGLDACGHFFFGELEGADDGLFAAMYVLQAMQSRGMWLSDMVAELPRTYGTPELRIPVRLLTYDAAQTSLLGAFADSSVEWLDGARISVEQGTVLLRRSGTEPMLSLRIEGNNLESYEVLLARCLEALPVARESIRSQLLERSVPAHH